MGSSGRIRIGTCGYHYAHWRGVFYPERLEKGDWFAYYAERFDTVELNNTFYRLPDESTFERWRARTPEGFLYALKFSRYGTHLKRLKDPEQPIEMFLTRAEKLGASLGPILVQLPPRFPVDPARLEAFLTAAPARHRWIVEFRDRSWLTDSVFRLLERHGAALCLHDMIQRHPRLATADFTYLRYHGERYTGSYSPQKLAADARWIRGQLDGGRDVYVYFNNDADGHAVKNAADLRRYLTSP